MPSSQEAIHLCLALPALGSLLHIEPHDFFLWLSFVDFSEQDGSNLVTPSFLFIALLGRDIHRGSKAGNATVGLTGRVLAPAARSLVGR